VISIALHSTLPVAAFFERDPVLACVTIGVITSKLRRRLNRLDGVFRIFNLTYFIVHVDMGTGMPGADFCQCVGHGQFEGRRKRLYVKLLDGTTGEG
jgi:hypothetical protein